MALHLMGAGSEEARKALTSVNASSHMYASSGSGLTVLCQLVVRPVHPVGAEWSPWHAPPRRSQAGCVDCDHVQATRGAGRWPKHLPVGALRVGRSSARYEQAVRFYRDLVGAAVLET